MSDPTTSGGLHAPELRDDREDAALGCDDQTFRRKMLNPLNLRGRLRYSFSACRAHYLNGFFHAHAGCEQHSCRDQSRTSDSLSAMHRNLVTFFKCGRNCVE